MGIAAGGRIKQAIVRDTGRKWLATQTKTFNLQILNTLHFHHVTGFRPPEPPIDARTYAAYGYPFFSMYEEPSDVSGDFSHVHSVGELDGIQDLSISPKIEDITNRLPPFSRPSAEAGASSTYGSGAHVEWVCHICTLINSNGKDSCDACMTHRRPPASLGVAATSKGNQADWTCAACTLVNGAEKSECDACMTSRTSLANSAVPAMATGIPRGRDENKVGFWNPNGPMNKFRPLQELERELAERGTAIF